MPNVTARASLNVRLLPGRGLRPGRLTPRWSRPQTRNARCWQRQQIGVATGLLAQRFAITPQRAWTVAADNVDDENGGVANSKLRIVKDQPWPVIRGLRC